jgi:hypothetical protein
MYKRIMRDWAAEQLREWDAHTEQIDDVAAGFRDIFADAHSVTSHGEAYFVSADMAAVAVAAAKSMPTQELRLDDLPSETGFLLYDRPIGVFEKDVEPNQVQGFMWILGPGGKPYWAGSTEDSKIIGPVGSEANSKDPPLGYTREVDIYPLGLFPRMYPHVLPLMGLGYLMSWEINGTPRNDPNGLGPVLLATWTLMQQTLTVSSRVPADRPERRRSARLGLPQDLIVVRLRRKHLDQDTSDDGTKDVAWSHRWLVSGHWRNQWLPSRMAHRLQWIAGHVKGPQHKPLVVKDRVTAWVR